MKSKLKKIIPIAIAVTAIILAVIFIQFKPSEAKLSDNPFDLAQNYLVEHSYEQAIAEFEKAIELDPMNVEAYLGIAEAYEAIGNRDMAVQWLEKGFEATGDERLQEKLEEVLNGDVEATEVETTVIFETISGGTTMVEVTYTKKQEYFDGSYCTFTYNEDKTLIKAEYFDQQGQFVTEKEYSKDDVESYQKRQLKEQLSKKERANTTIETAAGSKEVYDENGELKMNEDKYGVENYDNGNLVSSIMRVDDDNPANRGYDYKYYTYYNGFQYPEKEICDRDEDSYDREAIYSFEFDEYGTPTKQYITCYYDNDYIEPERIEQCEFKNIYDDNGKLCCVITIINSGGHYHSMDIVQKKNDTIIMDGWHSKSNNYIHIYIPNYDETGIVSELLIEKYICSCCEN